MADSLNDRLKGLKADAQRMEQQKANLEKALLVNLGQRAELERLLSGESEQAPDAPEAE